VYDLGLSQNGAFRGKGLKPLVPKSYAQGSLDPCEMNVRKSYDCYLVDTANDFFAQMLLWQVQYFSTAF
jgi:hypothetical protein